MSEIVEHQVLLELALAFGAADSEEMLASRCLPLLVRRTAARCCGIVRWNDNEQDASVVAVSPKAHASSEAWNDLLSLAAQDRQSDGGLITTPSGTHLHTFVLAGYGTLLLERRDPLPVTFTRSLLPVLKVMANVLISLSQRQELSQALTAVAEFDVAQRALIEALPDPAWIAGPSGRVEVANTAFNWLGQATRDALVQQLAGNISEDRPGFEVVDGISGRVFDVAARSLGRNATGPSTVLAVAHDVTSRAQDLSTSTWKTAFLQLLMELAMGFINCPTDEVDTAIDAALARAGSFVGAHRAYVFLHDLQRNVTSNTHEWCAPRVEPQIDELQDLPFELFPHWNRAHERGEAYTVGDVLALAADDPDRQLLEPQGITTLFTVPILVDEQLLGFVGFDSVGQAKTWSPVERQLLRLLAEIVGNAIERRRQQETLARQRQESAMLTRRLELAQDALDHAIWEWDLETGRTYLSPELRRIVGYPTPVEVDPTTFRDLLVNGGADELQGAVERAMAAADGRFEAFVSLRGDEASAIPVIVRGAIERDALGTAVRMAGTISDQRPVLARQQAERRLLERQSVLSQISEGFVSRPFRLAIEQALGALGSLFDASRTSLLVLNAAGDRFAANHEWCAEGVESVADRVTDVAVTDVIDLYAGLSLGQVVLVEDVQSLGEPQSTFLASFGIRSLASVPLFVDGAFAGALGLDQVERNVAWTEDDRLLLQAVGEVVSAAIARNRAEEELARARQQAEQANEAKSRFLSMVSHELRTPMTGVLGMTELLLDASLTPRHHRYLEMAIGAATSMVGLLNDLIDIAAIERGTVSLQPSTVDVRALCADVNDFAASLPSSSATQLELVIDPAVPQRCWIDRQRLRQVLVNLIGNAIRHADGSQVRLEVGVAPAVNGGVHASETAGTPPAASRLRFSVSDHGPGIPRDLLDKIFEPFHQVPDAPRTSTQVGLGLGLTIVRELVEAMGGSVDVESDVGKGATFSVLVPLIAVRASGSEDLPDTTRHELPELRILVAEDDPVNLEVIRGFLQDHPVALTVVSNGKAAVEACHNGAFDVVLMDCFMPVLDGLSATRQLKASPATASVPIIAMTADASPDNLARCRSAGADGSLIKPFTRLALESMLAQMPRSEGCGQEPQVLSLDTDPLPIFDPNVLETYLGGGHDRSGGTSAVHDILEIFREQAPILLKQAHRACERDDRGALHRSLHTLASSANAVGMLRLAVAARRVEQSSWTADPETLRRDLQEVDREADLALAALASDGQHRG